MIMNVHDDAKSVHIWLTRAEAQDDVLGEKLKETYAKYKQQKYMVFVFYSGIGDLADNTAGLLRQNRDREK